MEKLRRDSTLMGLILGFLAPGILFGLIYGVLFLIGKQINNSEIVSIQKILLLSIIPNLFLLRYYLLKLKYDLTGRGILMATFILAILFAILEFTL